MVMDPRDISFKYYNLFNNTEISENLNKAMADNIVDLYTELEKPLTRGYQGIQWKFLDIFFNKTPIEDMLKNLVL